MNVGAILLVAGKGARLGAPGRGAAPPGAADAGRPFAARGGAIRGAGSASRR